MPPRRSHRLLDHLGATGSLLCALHCALLPLLIAALPSIGVAAWLGDGFEVGFVLFASLFGLAVLMWSYRRHRIGRALALLLPTLLGVWTGSRLRNRIPQDQLRRLIYALLAIAGLQDAEATVFQIGREARAHYFVVIDYQQRGTGFLHVGKRRQN